MDGSGCIDLVSRDPRQVGRLMFAMLLATVLKMARGSRYVVLIVSSWFTAVLARLIALPPVWMGPGMDWIANTFFSVPWMTLRMVWSLPDA